MSHKTGNNRHLVSTTHYQLPCYTRLETTDTLLKPHTINCHVVQVWKQAITLFQPHTINCHAIQDWQQQTPCSNHTLSIVMSYKTGNNRHLVSTTLYQLSCHTRIATDTLFQPHIINCHFIQNWKQQTPYLNHTIKSPCQKINCTTYIFVNHNVKDVTALNLPSSYIASGT